MNLLIILVLTLLAIQIIAFVASILFFHFLNQKHETIMALSKAEFDLLREQINEATNKIAAKIEELIERAKSPGLSIEDEQAVYDGFTAISEQLKALAADPENPVPDPEPNPGE